MWRKIFKSLGGMPFLVSVVGDDDAGVQLKGQLNEIGIGSQHLVKDSQRPTTRKTRVMSQHHHLLRIDYEKRAFLSPQVEEQVLNQVKTCFT